VLLYHYSKYYSLKTKCKRWKNSSDGQHLPFWTAPLYLLFDCEYNNNITIATCS